MLCPLLQTIAADVWWNRRTLVRDEAGVVREDLRGQASQSADWAGAARCTAPCVAQLRSSAPHACAPLLRSCRVNAQVYPVRARSACSTVGSHWYAQLALKSFIFWTPSWPSSSSLVSSHVYAAHKDAVTCARLALTCVWLCVSLQARCCTCARLSPRQRQGGSVATESASPSAALWTSSDAQSSDKWLPPSRQAGEQALKSELALCGPTRRPTMMPSVSSPGQQRHDQRRALRQAG